MAPAFSSTRQAGAFGLLLLTLLALPLLIGKSLLPDRREIYSSIGWEMGPYPYIYQQIFEEQGDIDIAFVGSSHMLLGLDTPYVQEQLGKHLGRPAVVRSLCWGGAGFDALHFVTRDLLEHRKVRMLVIYSDYQGHDSPNALAPAWFRFGDNARDLAGLPWPLAASYYYAAIAGMPRNLLSLVRPNIPAELFSEKKNYLEETNRAVNPAARLGSLGSQLGFSPDFKVLNPNFSPYAPNSSARPADTRVYSPETSGAFQFFGPALPEWQLQFARKFASRARDRGARLVLLHIPQFEERRENAIVEPEFWPDVLRTDIAMIGIPPAKMFAGLTDEDVRKLYQDGAHLNKNGQEYFTSLVTPSLLRLYDFSPPH